jgi:hypothetical protein
MPAALPPTTEVDDLAGSPAPAGTGLDVTQDSCQLRAGRRERGPVGSVVVHEAFVGVDAVPGPDVAQVQLVLEELGGVVVQGFAVRAGDLVRRQWAGARDEVPVVRQQLVEGCQGASVRVWTSVSTQVPAARTWA